jgi:hypothetical protein
MGIKFPLLVLCRTSTTGASSPYAVDESAIKPGYRSLTRATADGSLNDGDTVYYECRDSTVINGPNLFEYGIGTWNNTTKQLARTTILQSSSGTSAIVWGAGTRDLIVSDSFAALFLQAANNLSDLANVPAARANLSLGSAALATTAAAGGAGAAGDVPILDGGGNIPVSMLGNVVASKLPTGTKLAFVQDVVPTGWTQVTGIDDAIFMCTSGSGHSGTTGGVYTNNASGLNSWQVSWGLGVGGHGLSPAEVGITQSATPGSPGANNIPIMGIATTHIHPLTDGKTWRPPSLTQCVGIAP